MSFRHVGEAKHGRFATKYANYVNEDETRTRHVAAYQKRNLSDLLFPFVTERIQRRNGDFWFTFTCESTGEVEIGQAKLDSLVGEVCIFKSKEDWARFRDADQLLTAMNELRRRKSFAQADAKFQNFRDTALQLSDICIPFKLLRNGEVYVGEPKVADEQLSTNSSSYSSDRIGVAFNQWIANHAYFFIRDLCHFHQHHSPAEDTILILQDVGTSRGWRNNVLYSLHHYIIGQRRSTWLVDLYRAQGVLAYAKSFKGISSVVAPETSLQTFQFDAVAESIDARIKEIDFGNHVWEQSRSWRIARLGSYRGAGLALLAIFCSLLISVMQPYFLAHHDVLLAIDNWISSNFAALFSYFLATIIVLFAITDDRHFGAKESHLDWFAMRRNVLGFRDFATLGMLSPTISGLFFIAISALLLLLIVYRPF